MSSSQTGVFKMGGTAASTVIFHKMRQQQKATYRSLRFGEAV